MKLSGEAQPNNGMHPTANSVDFIARLGRHHVSPRRVMPGVMLLFLGQELMMNTSLILLVLLIGSASGSAVPAKNTFQFVTKKGKHTAKITFTTKPFNRSEHRVVQTSQCLRIDGREPLGTDCTVPSVEIESLRLFLDGKEIGVPKRLYADCYQPPFLNRVGRVVNEQDVKNYFAVRISDDLQSVFVFMSGGDAAGSYQIIWVLRKDGRHTRFSGACSDCGFIDFQGGFFNSN